MSPSLPLKISFSIEQVLLPAMTDCEHHNKHGTWADIPPSMLLRATRPESGYPCKVCCCMACTLQAPAG